MEFIEAGSNNPQENVFRRGFSFVKNKLFNYGNRLNEIISGAPSSQKENGFKPLIPETNHNTFSEGFKNLQKSVILGATMSIAGGLGSANPRENPIPETPTFRQFNPNISQKNQGFGPIQIKTLRTKEVLPGIDPKQLIESSRKINKDKMDFTVPYTVSYFDKSGGGHRSIPKGTQITYTHNQILSLFDKKAGKYQSYASIEPFTMCLGADNRTIENISGGYIRTPWFDGVVNRKESTETIIQPKKVSFAGWIGPNGKEIPEYILRAVTVNYFGKTIIPKIHENIALVDTKISITRKTLATEYLEKNIPFHETDGYEMQLKNLEQKKTWKKLEQSIQSFTLNDEKIDNTTVDILQSLQKKPDWQNILQKAAYIQKKQRK